MTGNAGFSSPHKLNSQSVIVLNHWFQISPGRRSQALEWSKNCEWGEAFENEVNTTREGGEWDKSTETQHSKGLWRKCQLWRTGSGAMSWGDVQITCMGLMTGGGKKPWVSVRGKKKMMETDRERKKEKDIQPLPHGKTNIGIKIARC